MRISDWSSAACSSDLLVLALVAHHPASHHATSHHPAAAHHAPFGGGRSKTDRPAVTDVHNDFCAFGGRQFDAARRMRLRQKTAIACDLMEATAIVEAEAIESCIGGVQQPEPQALALGLEDRRDGAIDEQCVAGQALH